MPLNLMTLTTEKGPIHVNPAQLVSVKPAPGGTELVLATGDKVVVIDDHQRVVKNANARAPDGF